MYVRVLLSTSSAAWMHCSDIRMYPFIHTQLHKKGLPAPHREEGGLFPRDARRGGGRAYGVPVQNQDGAASLLPGVRRAELLPPAVTPGGIQRECAMFGQGPHEAYHPAL